MQRRELLIAAGAAAAAPGCTTWLPLRNLAQPLEALPDDRQPPAAPRELRGAWVATVANIDWPSRKGLDVAAQRAEMEALLDAAAALRLNALMLQVRPSADALYPSAIEPWTEYLTGMQGQDPGWDPLAEWLAGAHRRGIDLHAWLNPYRAKAAPAISPPSALHVTQRRPDLAKTYGNLQWMDPGEPDAAAQTLAVCADLLHRYAIDGLHIDDYFYPYPIKDAQAQDLPFPDQPSYERLGGGMPLADWRRRNVDELVQAMHATVRRVRPDVPFSVSPFGIGKPALRPPGITGFSQYDLLYADVERWLQEGWMDALVPQLYWAMARTAQAFPVLLDYWLAQTRLAGRHIWAGLYTSRLPARESDSGWAAEEILNQIALTRQRPAAGGHVHFSMVALLNNRVGVADALRAGPYAQAALPPASPWLDSHSPQAPQLAATRLRDGRLSVALAQADPRVSRHSLWAAVEGQWQFFVAPAGPDPVMLPAGSSVVVAASVTRTGTEGARQAYLIVA